MKKVTSLVSVFIIAVLFSWGTIVNALLVVAASVTEIVPTWVRLVLVLSFTCAAIASGMVSFAAIKVFSHDLTKSDDV